MSIDLAGGGENSAKDRPGLPRNSPAPAPAVALMNVRLVVICQSWASVILSATVTPRAE
jgi:hypothetical protein